MKKVVVICDLCKVREAKSKRSDRQGHSVRLCYACNSACHAAKMSVSEIIVRAVERDTK